MTHYPMWNEHKSAVLDMVGGNLVAIEPSDPRYNDTLNKGVVPFQPEAFQDTLVSVPSVVTRFQFQAALVDASLLGVAKSLIAHAPASVQIRATEAHNVRRDSDLVRFLVENSEVFGGMDDIFIAASKIED